MTKRRVFLDGNGSGQINVEGLGVYVPASELAQLKQKLGIEVQQLKEKIKAMELDRSTHIDDIGIDRFTNAMRLKMSYSRAKGRSGWDDPAQCSGEQLAAALVEHLSKGNAGTFEDVANFAMMLHQRKESPSLLADAVNETRAKAVMNFAEVNRGAYLSGFVTADLTVYDVYQSARNHVKDNYGYDTKLWNDDDAKTARNALNELSACAGKAGFIAGVLLVNPTAKGRESLSDEANKYSDSIRQAAKDGA